MAPPPPGPWEASGQGLGYEAGPQLVGSLDQEGCLTSGRACLPLGPVSPSLVPDGKHAPLPPGCVTWAVAVAL